MSKVLEVVQMLKRQGKRIVVANGCFDTLHAGHKSLLRFAKQQGDILLILLNSDESVTRLKGYGRPIISQWWRKIDLLALDCVDAVIIFDEDTPAELLSVIRPNVLVKGSDTPRPWPGEEFCGECVAAPFLAGYSTTSIAAETAKG